MSDLATLGLYFETKGAEEAARHLDAISAKAEKTEASVQHTRKATDALSDNRPWPVRLVPAAEVGSRPGTDVHAGHNKRHVRPEAFQQSP